ELPPPEVAEDHEAVVVDALAARRVPPRAPADAHPHVPREAAHRDLVRLGLDPYADEPFEPPLVLGLAVERAGPRVAAREDEPDVVAVEHQGGADISRPGACHHP